MNLSEQSFTNSWPLRAKRERELRLPLAPDMVSRETGVRSQDWLLAWSGFAVNYRLVSADIQYSRDGNVAPGVVPAEGQISSLVVMVLIVTVIAVIISTTGC